jgi:endonuclease/exonuclease/phosphatase (EEP) superfamily protein YafD
LATAWAALLFTGGLAFLTLLGWAARWHWTFDLIAHFPVQLALAAAAPLLLLAGMKPRKMAIFPLVVLLANGARTIPLYVPAQADSPLGTTHRAMLANVLSHNQNQARFIELVRTLQPDFFLVLEMNNDWRTALEALESDYPYVVMQPREDNFGIGLFSRAPITGHTVHVAQESELPSIVATLAFADGEITVFGTHPLPPMGRQLSKARNGHLREMANLVAGLPDPKILLGDLNVTSWSPHFTDLLEGANLRDARRGFGIQPSWPDLPWPMRIPIDHTLVSHDIYVANRFLAPPIGSDHRPLVIDFQLHRYSLFAERKATMSERTWTLPAPGSGPRGAAFPFASVPWPASAARLPPRRW